MQSYESMRHDGIFWVPIGGDDRPLEIGDLVVTKYGPHKVVGWQMMPDKTWQVVVHPLNGGPGSRILPIREVYHALDVEEVLRDLTDDLKEIGCDFDGVDEYRLSWLLEDYAQRFGRLMESYWRAK